MAVEEQRIDWRVASESAVLTLAIALPPFLIVPALKSGDLPGQESNLWMIIPVAWLVGFAAGGFGAGKRIRTTPLMHAALAGALAFGAMFAISTTRRAIRGAGFPLEYFVQLLLLAQVCVSCSLLGGYVAARRTK